MTEHSKISLKQSKPVKAGDSLFERANGAFGLDGFSPAAPPRNLSGLKRPLRKSVKKQAEPTPKVAEPIAPPAVTPVEMPVEMPVSAAVEAPVAQQVNAKVPEPAQTEPVAVQKPVVPDVSFSIDIHEVDREHLADQGMIVPDGPVTGLLEEFRIVKRQLIGDAREGGTASARRILVCSPHSGEGKTYCAVNLALALAAERDIEVLLIDADFAKPSILNVLGIEAELGFMDALSDHSIQPETLVKRTDIDGLFVLGSGNRTTSDAEYLASARTGDVLGRLTESAPDRIVIFDTSPALAASPAAELAKHVGQAILVARADDTGRNALEDSYQLLSACPDIKLLLNAAQFSPSGRSFGSYGVYGE